MLYNKILEYQDELFADLNELMAIESVDGARDVDCAAALDFILKRAADFGLTSEKVTEKSAQVELGEGGRLCGILQLEISTPANEAKVLSQFRAGRAVNAVPDLAYVMLDSSGYDEQLLMRLADAGEGSFEFNYTIDGLMIVSRGRAAHACEPQKGYNAATALADLISHAYDVHEIGLLTSFIHYAINGETNGRSLGLKMNDGVSGALTVNLGTVYIDDHEARASVDIRYPVTFNGEYVLRQFRSVAEYNGLRVKVLHHDSPLYVEKDSELVRLLCDAYESVTGEKAEVYATGGGTYARKLGGRGVAFGPNFKGDDIRMHNADESVDKENFLRHMQICFEAMYRLYTLE